jgi:hypothetical protein
MPLRGRVERKVVSRQRDFHQFPDPHGLVEMTRPASALILAQHGDAIAAALSGIVAQGILAQKPASPQVDMSACLEARQIAAAWIDELVTVGGFGEIGD